MNPKQEFCPNEQCPDRGKIGTGNIGVHSQKEQRCMCRTCGKTFSIENGTNGHRLAVGLAIYWPLVLFVTSTSWL